MRTKRLIHRKRSPGPAELNRMRRLEEAWRAERRHADEEWTRELERRKTAATSVPERATSKPPPWAELELLRGHDEARRPS
ncbi:MAG TPA: hypothetical protein VKA30_10105 [Actinomycetota bacterium]|nr:hypothetical protein [Actinomycetota bacterium]